MDHIIIIEGIFDHILYPKFGQIWIISETLIHYIYNFLRFSTFYDFGL